MQLLTVLTTRFIQIISQGRNPGPNFGQNFAALELTPAPQKAIVSHL
jgi:hypothetical protein